MSRDIISEAYADLASVAARHAPGYRRAAPFPSIHLDGVFHDQVLEAVLDEFPDLSASPQIAYHNANENEKYASRGEARFGPRTRALMHFLNSEPFLNFIQVLTGIEEPLLPDPYFWGGGLHEIKPGGLLKVHADFNLHPRTRLDRRVNVLIYLNKDWREEYGGHFELWDPAMTRAEARLLPVFNRMAVFSTTSTSFHGHPDPLRCPPGRSRRSIALYYYSNGRPASEVGEKHTTLFRGRDAAEQAVIDRASSKLGPRLEALAQEATPPFLYRAVDGWVRRAKQRIAQRRARSGA